MKYYRTLPPAWLCSCHVCAWFPGSERRRRRPLSALRHAAAYAQAPWVEQCWALLIAAYILYLPPIC